MSGKPLVFDPAAVLANRSWFDRAIGAVAPSWEVRRMEAKLKRHLFEYQAAQSDRIFAPKNSALPAESLRTNRDRIVMMYEARDLIENFGPGKIVLTKFAENVAPSEYAPNTGDRAYDCIVAEYFHDWCRKADFEGRHCFKKLVEIAVQTRPVDGDCGFIIRRMDGGEIKLQLVAGDRIGNPTRNDVEENHFAGITVDKYGRPISFRIYSVNRRGVYGDPEEISRDNFLHYADQFRTDQYRGVSDFHPVLRTARMIKDILEAEQVGVKYASQQAALIFNSTGTAPTRDLFTPQGAANMANGAPPLQEESQYGVLKYLQRGDDVRVMPSRPGSAFQGFTDLLMQHYGLGLGIPCGVLFGTQDYHGPSVRAEFAQADRAFARHKSNLCSKVLEPTKEAVILNGIAMGEIPMPTREAGESVVMAVKRALRGSWRFPAKLTIDVGRESDANLNENMAGAKSLQEIAAEQDADAFQRLEDNAQVAAEVQRLAEKYDVPETMIRIVGRQLPSTPAMAAASGDSVGESAAEAQAASTGATVPPEAPEAPEAPDAGAMPAEPNDGADSEDPNADPEAQDPAEMSRVQRILSGSRGRRSRALGSLLKRANRMAQLRAKLSKTTANTAKLAATFDALNN